MKNLNTTLAGILCLVVAFISHAQYPTLDLNGLEPEESDFTQPIDSSKIGELTILSFNIRDVIGKSRTLADFQMLTKIFERADIVVLQEQGAKGYTKTNEPNPELRARLIAMTEAYKSFLGPGWESEIAPQPTPDYYGRGAELPIVLYRTRSNSMSIFVSWQGYFDLGTRRDMALFTVNCQQGGQVEEFTIGSVHTKPSCPVRGQELTQIGQYIEDNEDEKFIIMGDLNWGADATDDGCVSADKFDGEEYINTLQDDNKVFILFSGISYNRSARNDPNAFRTNLNARKSKYMYDQFLVSNYFATKMADGASLLEDCGFFDISELKHFKDQISKHVKLYEKGLKKGASATGGNPNSSAIKDEVAAFKAKSSTVDVATHKLSDHKPIWMQLKLF